MLRACGDVLCCECVRAFVRGRVIVQALRLCHARAAVLRFVRAVGFVFDHVWVVIFAWRTVGVQLNAWCL